MRGDEVKFDPGDVPKKAIPDKQPQIPAQQQELKQRNAHENIPKACWSQVPACAGHCIPGRGLSPNAPVPNPKTDGIDKDKEPKLERYGIAELDGGCKCFIELRYVRGQNNTPLDEAADDW